MKSFSVVVARLVSSSVVHVDIQCRSYSFIKQLEAISIRIEALSIRGLSLQKRSSGNDLYWWLVLVYPKYVCIQGRT